MNTDSFIMFIKKEDIYKDIAEDVETRFGTSNYELDRPLPKGKNKKVIGLMKDELDETIMKELRGLRARAYSYLLHDGNRDKDAKGTKKCVIKTKDYKNCLEQLNSKIK